MEFTKNIIMFHEINENIISIIQENLEEFKTSILTFDDGLYSQYYYFEKINELLPNNLKIFYISTNIINETNDFILNISCEEAHELYFNENNKKAYMNLKQIKFLKNQKNCYIGGHGHNHLHAKLQSNLKLKKFYSDWIEDFKCMQQWFYNNKIDLDFYCTPYNEVNDILIAGAKKLYSGAIIGPERIAIETYK